MQNGVFGYAKDTVYHNTIPQSCTRELGSSAYRVRILLFEEYEIEHWEHIIIPARILRYVPPQLFTLMRF